LPAFASSITFINLIPMGNLCSGK